MTALCKARNYRVASKTSRPAPRSAWPPFPAQNRAEHDQTPAGGWCAAAPPTAPGSAHPQRWACAAKTGATRWANPVAACIARRLVLHSSISRCGPTWPIIHCSTKWFGRGPQVQVGVQVAAKAFDIEQGLLQQHQLRLNLDLEAPRRLEQPHEHQAQGNLLERPVEVGLARLRALPPSSSSTPRSCWHPTGLDVQLGHTLVVTPKKCREVLCQVLLSTSVRVPTMPKSSEM